MAFSTICATRHRLVADNGLVSCSTTRSPTPHAFSSSCATYFVLRRTKKYKAHDEKNACGVGDRVLLMETRPTSATKRWRVAEILEKAK